MSGSLKIAVVTDPRFLGGTGAAVASDVSALAALGHRIELLLFQSDGHFQHDDPENETLLALTELTNVSKLSGDNTLYDAVFFHNPQVFQKLAIHQPVRARRAFLIVHHPPFLGNGALCYDPFKVDANIRKHFDQKRVEWVPISGLIRAQINSFLPFLLSHPEDWPNTFNPEEFEFSEPDLTKPVLRIGRHGRAHRDKWPDTPDEIRASLPASSEFDVRVLGASRDFFKELKTDVEAWELLPFNSISVQAFLNSIDVFCYHHASVWREAFGRTIVEAMLMGRPCILDPSLEPTFGELATYCQAKDVSEKLSDLRADPQTYLDRARFAYDQASTQFSTQNIENRLSSLLNSLAVRKGSGAKEAGALKTLKKYVGFKRRSKALKGVSVES